MPIVLNCHKDSIPVDAVYVGRPSKWGNPFIMGRDGSRDEVCEKYLEYLVNTPELFNSLCELKGKDLVCYCAPKRCHANVLLQWANKEK